MNITDAQLDRLRILSDERLFRSALSPSDRLAVAAAVADITQFRTGLSYPTTDITPSQPTTIEAMEEVASRLKSEVEQVRIFIASLKGGS